MLTPDELGDLIAKAVLESRKRSRSPYVYERLDQIDEWVAVLVTMARPGVGTTSATMALTTPPSTGATNDIALVAQPVVQLAPAVEGITVTATLVSGDGTESGGPVPGIGLLGGTVTAVTNGSGLATFTNLKITGTVGDHGLVFTAPGYTATTSGVIRTVPGAATKAFITTSPAGAATGVPFITQPVVQLRDASDNPTNTGTTNVVAALASGTGSLSGTLTVACVAGVASFPNLTITGTGAHTISFTPTSLTAATSDTVTLESASATALAIGTQPSGAAALAPFTVQPSVRLTVSGTPYTHTPAGDEDPLDDSGKWSIPTGLTGLKVLDGTVQAINPAEICRAYANSTAQATISSDQEAEVTFEGGATGSVGVVLRDQGDGACYLFAGGPADNVVSLFRITAALQFNWLGNSTHTFAAGTSRLKLRGSGSTLTAYANDVLLITAQDGNLTGGRWGRMCYGDGEIGVSHGGSLSTNFAQADVVITAVKQTGTGTLSGTTTANTDANGLATFTNLTLSQAGNFTLRFSSGVLTPIDSATIVVSAGAATQLGMVTQPANATEDSPYGTQPVVRILDSTGNPVLTAGTTITAALQTGTGTISGDTTKDTNGSGISTFLDLTNSDIGAKVLRFTSPGLTAVDSSSFTVQAAAPPPDPGGLYPNQPAGMTTISEWTCGSPIPAAFQIFVGSGGWNATNTSNMTQFADATDPASPSGTIRINIPPGTYGGGIPGQGIGTGFGDLGYDIGNTVGFKREIYCCVYEKRDANFEWHANNDKWFELGSGNSGGNVIQLLVYWFNGSGSLHVALNDTSKPNQPQGPGETFQQLVLGLWHRTEFYIKYGLAGTSRIKVWRDGTLLCDTTALDIPGQFPTWQEMYFRNFRGGGGEVKTRHSQIHYGHIYVSVRT